MNYLVSNSSSKPLHIAFAIPSFASGGAGRVILTLARGLVERGHNVDLVLFNTSFHYPEEIPDDARLFVINDKPDEITENKPTYTDLRKRLIPVRPHSRRYGWFRLAGAMKWHPLILPTQMQYRQARQLAGYINEQQPDIIFPTLPRMIVSTLLAGHLVDDIPPVVPVIQGLMEKRRKHKRLRYKALFQDAAHVVTVSDGVTDSVCAEVGLPKEKISTIYNPVVTPELATLQSQNPDHPWFTDGGPPIILACGRLIELKQFPVLIQAFARLSEQRRYRLILLGEGPQRKPLEELVRKLNLRQKVSLPGWTDNPSAFMSRASLFVLSSRNEGLPTVLIEALACGCPCVSTDCPAGPSEILQDGEIGPLVTVGDHTALADAMLRTLDNPPDKQKLLDRAAFFSLERATEVYEDLIKRVTHQLRGNNNAFR